MPSPRAIAITLATLLLLGACGKDPNSRGTNSEEAKEDIQARLDEAAKLAAEREAAKKDEENPEPDPDPDPESPTADETEDETSRPPDN